MGRMKFDPLVKRVRGRVGNYVFRKSGGRTIISAVPDHEPGPPTPAQEAARQKFREASAYADRVLDDPALRAGYEQLARERKTFPRSVAMGDFLHRPEVKSIELADYTGKAGDKIAVVAEDDVEVVAVRVTIRDAATSAVLEEGPATLLHEVWLYTATTALAAGQAVTIAAQATDRPGHAGTAEAAYP